MNKQKRYAKIAISLKEATIQTKLTDKHFSVKVVAAGSDGKKGTADDKILKNKKSKISGSDTVKEESAWYSDKYNTPVAGDTKTWDSWSEWESDPKEDIKTKIERARAKRTDPEDEELDHNHHQKRTNESTKSYEKFITEVKGTTAVFTFGRFNPPTIGHEKLLNVVGNTASKNRADSFIFASNSQDTKKNPLSKDQKIVFMKMMFPKHRSSMMKTDAVTALHALSEIHKAGKYSKVIMVVGSDRVSEFDTLLNRYNDVDSKHGYYRFGDIDVVSAGERDPDAEGADGMSASKMRAAVKEGNYDVFKMGVPPSVSDKDCHALYNAVAKGMKVKQDQIKEEWGLDELEEDYEEEILEYEKAKGGYDVRKMQVQRKLSLRSKAKAAKSKPPSRGLSPSQRRKMAIRMKIQAKKPSFIMKRLRSMKRAATKAKLTVRARKSAIMTVIKKFYPKLRTKSKSDLSYAERGRISQIVKKKKGLIDRLAKRGIKDARKRDVERRKSMNKPKEK
jgi:hypothetical protein